MNDFLNHIWLMLSVVNHVIPLVITILLIVVFWAIKTYFPQLHYIALVADATTDTGVIKLAKYMAKRNGGKHINTDSLWESFIPAARAVSERYRLKVD